MLAVTLAVAGGGDQAWRRGSTPYVDAAPKPDKIIDLMDQHAPQTKYFRLTRGHHLLERDAGGRLVATDAFLIAPMQPVGQREAIA